MAFPGAIAISLLAKLLVLPAWPLTYLRVWLHEFGHATIAWCGSRAATPLALSSQFAWTSHNTGKSMFVYVCFLFLIGVMLFVGWTRRAWLMFAFAVALFAAQTLFNWFLPDKYWEITVLFFGCGGEMVLGTLLVVAFYYHFPPRLHWEFFRFVALIVGMYALLDASILWFKVKGDPNLMPWGTGIWGRGDANGDLNRLHALHGWSKQQITQRYLVTAGLCWLSVVGHYAFYYLKSLRETEPATAP